MKKSRFTDSQILAVLKQSEAGIADRGCAGSTGSARRRSINGDRSSAGWTLR